MSKRWTYEDDAFLLTYADAVGADFIASHDLGRPDGAGSRRLKKLTDSGARIAFAQAQLAGVRFDMLAGRPCFDPMEEIERWEDEIARLSGGKADAA